MPKSPFALSALIQNDIVKQLESFLVGRERNLGKVLTANTADDLLSQLEGEHRLPKGVDIEFVREIGGLAVARIFDGQDPLDHLRGVLVGQLAALARLLHADSPQERLDALRDVFVGPLADLWKTIGPLFASQLSIAISFATTALLMPEKAAEAIEEAVVEYFFSRTGFRTVDGSQLVAPIHLENLDFGESTALKGIFSHRTADRYIRDLIRVVVEAANDARYDLARRLEVQLDLANDKRDKYEDWFKGFS